MQRWTALLYSIFLVGAVALVVLGAGDKRRGGTEPAAAVADAGADAEETDAPQEGGEGDGPERGAETPIVPTAIVDAGGTLLSGERPPALASDAPKRVRFGVVLVQYRGAQGAPPTSRSRDAALTLAKQIAEEARTDFKAAVAKGDKGSTEDLGFMPRGILEPAPEFELFSLPKGGIGGPVDTPRGYWVVRRID